MKPETEKALRAASTETQQEIIKLLADIMLPIDFADPLFKGEGSDEELTGDGELILEALTAHSEPAEQDETILSDADADRLHEAICEGRRQDAVDILNEVTGENFRSVEAQTNLFPDRCSL